jgi:hypothetical protein
MRLNDLTKGHPLQEILCIFATTFIVVATRECPRSYAG